ncbi:MAG: S8 family serine peptidase [Saprospiraceae bacterium]
MNFRLTIAAMLLCVTTIYAQQPIPKNYDLKIGLSSYEVSENYSDNMEYMSNVFDNQFFKIIQFYEHPTNEQKATLFNSGVELIAYLPNYAWLASFNENYDFTDLNTYYVRAIIDVPKEYKLSTALQLEDYPNHILDGDNVKLSVTFFNTVDIEKITADLTSKDFQNTTIEDFIFIKEVVVPISKINDFAALPYVQYIEPILPEPTFDGGFVEDRNNERGNYLASEQIGGLHYDGTGITIAVKESGTVDPTYANDFKGRYDNTLDNGAATGNHKTGVARRMGAYGNDNPLYQGMAFGSDIVSTVGNFTNLINTTSSIAVNNSYGYGCYVGNYGSSGRSNDNLIRTNPTFMIAYSAGNIGDTDCSYGAGVGWGTTTGDVKQAKNVIAVGALNTSDQLMNFSSRGPAPDGRIKPDMCAVGPGGTSYACPNVVGGFGQLYHAYNSINGSLPNSGLIKGILQNTADDLGNPGPDFKYGYGRINMRRAYEVIANNTIITDDVANGATDNHILNIPAGTKQVRIMLYWMDYEGTSGSSVALVNDLNLTVTDPNTTVYNPWVLDHTINAVNLDMDAVRAVDALNNMEQITIDNPTAGNHTITINGNSVPQGPQSYYIIYEFLEDEVTVTYPIGGESMEAGETQRIYWDSYGNTSGTFDLSYSTDNGLTWTSIVTGLSNATRFYDWTVPSVITGEAKVKVTRGAISDESAEGFSIIDIPNNLLVVWSCGSDVKLGWDAVVNATGYEVYQLGTKYMTSVGTTTNTHYTINGVSTTDNEYFAVRALGANNAKGRRTNSLEKTPGDVNCIPLELVGNAITSHPSGYFSDCYSPFDNNIKFEFLNTGVNAISSVSVSYQLDNGSIQTEIFNGTVASGDYGEHTFGSSISILTPGTYTLKAWVSPSDADVTNDTATSEITIYSGGTAAYPYTQTFDSWSNCSTGWGCDVACTLEENWYNIPYDVERGDTSDWRTYSGSTPLRSYNTGPSSDHTGSGKYLFIQAVTTGGSSCSYSQSEALSPCIDLTSTTYPNLSFWYHAYGSAIGELHVDVLVDGEWIEDVLTPIIGEKGDAWYQHSGFLTAYIGKKIILRFRYINGSSFKGQIAIDDIEIKERPPVEVEGIEITSHSELKGYFPDCYNDYETTVSFEFENFGTSALTTATMKYQLDAETIISETFNGNIAAGTTHTYDFTTAIDLSNLSTGTHTLTAWIEAASDVDLTNNDAVITFETYSSGTATYPFAENFDSWTGCSTSSSCNSTVCNVSNNWYNVPYDTEKGDDSDWRTRTGGTPTRNGGNATGPAGDHTSGNGNYLYTESSNGTGCQNGTLYLLTPCIDLSTATKPELSFWYHLYGSASGSISVDILTNNIWTEIFTISGNQGDNWIEGTVNLFSYAGQSVVLRFRGLTGNSWSSDMAIDDIEIKENAALPVELTAFAAKAVDNNFIQLNWQTATEINNKGFEILRSTDGVEFEQIGYQTGKGNSIEAVNYTFDDKNVEKGIWYYYQLKQVDFDGQFEMTSIVSASLEAEATFAISEPFPNPTNQSANIRISTNKSLDFDILIYNQLGQIVEQQYFKAGLGENLVQLNTSQWIEGIYIISIQNNGYRTTKKLVIQK